jgi:hypothetical protein
VNKLLLFVLGFWPAITSLIAQDSSLSVPVLKGWSAGIYAGQVIAHSDAVANTSGARPVGFELQYWRQQNGRNAFEICNCYPKQGPVLAYYQFNNKVLGSAVVAGYQLEPQYWLSKDWRFSMRGMAGLAWASNPYHPVRNPENQSYSTSVSAYLLYGLGVIWQATPKWALQGSASFMHISNGGLRQPNKGVNWPAMALHVQYSPDPATWYRGSKGASSRYWKNRPLRKDIGFFGIAKRFIDANGNNAREPIVGALAQVSKQVGRTNALTAGIEISFDASLQKRLKQDSLSGSPMRAGLLVGHEFLLGRFIFSQRIGVYVFNQNPYFEDWYHRWGLQYKMSRHWWAGFNLKAHKHVADYIDLRLVYSWE